MKILFYTHFYYPEVGAASVRMQYFVKALRSNGHDVKVVAPRPNYPQGKVYEGYQKFFIKDEQNGVVYLPIYSPRKFSVLKRGLTYISYIISSLVYIVFDSFSPDVIISSSPPISTALAAVLISKIKRKPILLDIRDLWPDIGIELGIIQNKSLISIFKKIDEFILRNSSHITLPLEGFIDKFLNKGVSSKDLSVIYNGADLEIFQPCSDADKLKMRTKYNLPQNKKILVYFGFFNFGMNDIEILNKAVLLLADCKDDLHVLLIGDGAQKDNFVSNLEGKIEYTHISPQPQKIVAELISVCDLSVIPLKKLEEHTGGFIPVKCLESWAAGVPVIMSTNDDPIIDRLFSESNAGITVEPGDPLVLADGIKSVLFDENPVEYGKNGRQYVEDNFDRTKQSEKLNRILETRF